MHTIRRLIAAALACAALASPALAVDNGGGNDSQDASLPSLLDIRQNIEGGRYTMAISDLKLVIAAEPNNADALNLMGYSLRKTADFDRAQGFYLRALKIDPGHLGANEYLGELYVETGQIEKARERLDVLEKLCGKSCEEYEDLAEALASL